LKIWKNTSTLDGFDKGITFTNTKEECDIILMGSKPIDLNQFPNLKGIFRAGIGCDNVPEDEAREKGIIVKYPSKKTIDIIFNETASYTCNLILRMLYNNIGTIGPWFKEPRKQLSNKNLLVIGKGNIGRRVSSLMIPFMKVETFDIIHNDISDLKSMMQISDCITIHIPKNDNNISFINSTKLSWMKDDSILINTSRGDIVDENALYKELEKSRLRAAFDVFWEEPYTGKLLKFHPNRFFMSPHIASTCIEFLEGCSIGLNQLVKELS